MGFFFLPKCFFNSHRLPKYDDDGDPCVCLCCSTILGQKQMLISLSTFVCCWRRKAWLRWFSPTSNSLFYEEEREIKNKRRSSLPKKKKNFHKKRLGEISCNILLTLSFYVTSFIMWTESTITSAISVEMDLTPKYSIVVVGCKRMEAQVEERALASCCFPAQICDSWEVRAGDW